MGAGIAEVFAKAGIPVRGIEYNIAALERGESILQKSTDRAVAKGKMDAAAQAELLGRIEFGTDIHAVKDCSLIIEAVNENLDLKTSIFKTVDNVAPADAILATNTSSLSVTKIAAECQDPSRVIGVHFFNPAPVQPLVELIRTVHTTDETVDQLRDFLTGLGKSPIVCTDRAGFIVNALLVPYLGSACTLFQDGFCTREEMDQAMKEKANYPMGPLTLMDLVGNDVCLAVLERMFDETKNRLVAPPSLLRQMVDAGMNGVKSGRGFYTYDKGKPTDEAAPVRPPRASRADELPERLVVEYLNNVVRMVEINYATCDDIDTGMKNGCAMPKPFDVLAEMGAAKVLEIQRLIFAETAEPAHRPARLLEELAAADDPAGALANLRAGE